VIVHGKVLLKELSESESMTSGSRAASQDHSDSEDSEQSQQEQQQQQQQGEGGGNIPPLAERKARWSNGSAEHDKGKCRPCAWVWKPDGCVNGTACSFCHTCEVGQMKVRKKQKIAQLKAHASQRRRNRAFASLKRQSRPAECGAGAGRSGAARAQLISL